jgi:steroid delta-isomerase-like uncharacterized protein
MSGRGKFVTPEEMRAQYDEVVEKVFNQHNPAAIIEYLSPDFVDHTSMGEAFAGVPEFEDLKADWDGIFRAFPDVRFTIDHVVAEGDKLMSWWTMRGTHSEEFLGVEATGQEVELLGGDVIRFAEGKMVEHWDFFDRFGLMRQVGAKSPPE